LELEESHTGQRIYESVYKFLFSRKNGEILKKNFIGICTDHGSNMISTGKDNVIHNTGKGLANRLLKDFKSIFIVHDYAHIFNLVIEEAVSEFPAEVLNIINGVCSHFSRSPQQKAKFNRFQRKITNKPPLEVLRYVTTRWSSLKESLDRILELEKPLTLFFARYGSSSQKKYFTKENLLYLKMLSCLLGKLHFYNKFFQGEDLNSYEVIRTLKESLVLIGELVVEIPDYLEVEISYEAQEKKFNLIYNIPFDKKDEYPSFIMNPLKFKENLLRQYSHLRIDLEGIDETFEAQLFKVALEFLICSLQKMKFWLPFNDQKLFNTEMIYLKYYDLDKWIYLKDKFPNIISQEDQGSFQEQIQRLKYNLLDIKADAAHYPILEVWRKNKSKFPLLFDLARAFLVIPYSSCCIERVFSKYKDIKTIKRNRLSISNLESCLLIKQEYGSANFEFSSDMFLRYKQPKLDQFLLENNEFSGAEKKQEKSENLMELEGDDQALKRPLDSNPAYVSQLTESIFKAATESFEKIFSGFNDVNDRILKRKPSDKLIRKELKKGKSNEIPFSKEDTQSQKDWELDCENVQEQESNQMLIEESE